MPKHSTPPEHNHTSRPGASEREPAGEAIAAATHDRQCAAVTAIVEQILQATADGWSEDKLQFLNAAVALVLHWNALLDDLDTARNEPHATTLERAGTLLSMLLRFAENATAGRSQPLLDPLYTLFEAVHDRTQGERPALLFDPPQHPSRSRVRLIARAYLAAAVDVLLAANLTHPAVAAWWGKPAELGRATKCRAQIMDRTAAPLVIELFHELRPDRTPISEAAAKAQARQWRSFVDHHRNDG